MKRRLWFLFFILFVTIPFGYSSLAWSQGQTQLEEIPLYDFTLMSLDGEEITLSSFLGKPILLTFFLTTCSHCQAESKALNAAYQKYHNANELQIIAIAPRMDSRENLVQFIDEYQGVLSRSS